MIVRLLNPREKIERDFMEHNYWNKQCFSFTNLEQTISLLGTCFMLLLQELIPISPMVYFRFSRSSRRDYFRDLVFKIINPKFSLTNKISLYFNI